MVDCSLRDSQRLQLELCGSRPVSEFNETGPCHEENQVGEKAQLHDEPRLAGYFSVATRLQKGSMYAWIQALMAI